MKVKRITPLYDRIVIEREKSAETINGIVVPDSSRVVPNRGTVVAVGGGMKDSPITVKVGDVVIFNEFAGFKMHVGDRELVTLREVEVFCIEALIDAETE